MSIIEAWTLWFSGDLPPSTVIWGVSVFWWGRVGKMMQFVGAITILADIIGPEKIRSFGTSLHGRITPATLIEFLKDCFDWYTVIVRHTLMKDYADEDDTVEEKSSRFKLDLLNYGVCFLLTNLIILLIGLPHQGWTFLIEAAILFGCLLVSISPIATVLTILVLAIAGIIINSVLIKPLARILENPALDRYIKILSLLFLLIGFHFELLAS